MIRQEDLQELMAINGGDHTVVSLYLDVDTIQETSEVIKLAPGHSQEASFIATPSNPGTYHVEIGGLKGSFVVVEPPLPAPEQFDYRWLIIVALVIAAIATGVYINRRKKMQRPT